MPSCFDLWCLAFHQVSEDVIYLFFCDGHCMFVCVLDVLWPGRIGFSEIYNYGIQLSLFIFLFKDVKLRLF